MPSVSVSSVFWRRNTRTTASLDFPGSPSSPSSRPPLTCLRSWDDVFKQRPTQESLRFKIEHCRVKGARTLSTKKAWHIAWNIASSRFWCPFQVIAAAVALAVMLFGLIKALISRTGAPLMLSHWHGSEPRKWSKWFRDVFKLTLVLFMSHCYPVVLDNTVASVQEATVVACKWCSMSFIVELFGYCSFW